MHGVCQLLILFFIPCQSSDKNCTLTLWLNFCTPVCLKIFVQVCCTDCENPVSALFPS